MAVLFKNFQPFTTILSAVMNLNFKILTEWDIKDELPTGNINGSNLNFTTAHNYVAGSLVVLVDGIRQLKGAGKHYVESGANSFSFNASYAPLSGQDVVCDYRRSDVTA